MDQLVLNIAHMLVAVKEFTVCLRGPGRYAPAPVKRDRLSPLADFQRSIPDAPVLICSHV